jgi:hypothetical protein
VEVELTGTLTTLAFLGPREPRRLFAGASFVDDRAKRVVDARVHALSAQALQPLKQLAGIAKRELSDGADAKVLEITLDRWAHVHERSQPGFRSQIFLRHGRIVAPAPARVLLISDIEDQGSFSSL